MIYREERCRLRHPYIEMFLTSRYILRPVTCMCFLIIQKSTDTKLFCGCSIPAGPVSGTRCFVSENSIKPITMFCALRRVHFWPSVTVDVMRIVAFSDEAISSVSGVHETIRTGLEEALSLVTIVIEVTRRLVSHRLGSCLTSFFTDETIIWSFSGSVTRVTWAGFK